MRILYRSRLKIRERKVVNGKIKTETTYLPASHDPGDIITDSGGRKYRVSPAGNLVCVNRKARKNHVQK